MCVCVWQIYDDIDDFEEIYEFKCWLKISWFDIKILDQQRLFFFLSNVPKEKFMEDTDSYIQVFLFFFNLKR